MTNDEKLKAMATLRGVTPEELRKHLSDMGKKSPRTGAISSSERAKELNRLSQASRKKKREEV